jgi:hypothetical protein
MEDGFVRLHVGYLGIRFGCGDHNETCVGKVKMRQLFDMLLSQIDTVDNVLEQDMPKIIPGAWKKAHGENMIGVWWYRISDGKLWYRTTGHHFDSVDKDTPEEGSDQRGWVRGRVGKIGVKYFMFLYSGPEFFDKLPGNVLHDIYNKVQDASQVDIQYVVDHEGYDLMSESNIVGGK